MGIIITIIGLVGLAFAFPPILWFYLIIFGLTLLK